MMSVSASKQRFFHRPRRANSSRWQPVPAMKRSMLVRLLSEQNPHGDADLYFSASKGFSIETWNLGLFSRTWTERGRYLREGKCARTGSVSPSDTNPARPNPRHTCAHTSEASSIAQSGLPPPVSQWESAEVQKRTAADAELDDGRGPGSPARQPHPAAPRSGTARPRPAACPPAACVT